MISKIYITSNYHKLENYIDNMKYIYLFTGVNS